MISAVTAKGAMHFTTFTGKMNADVLITYCQDLLHDDGGIVFTHHRRTPRPPLPRGQRIRRLNQRKASPVLRPTLLA
jgi:hypothetical protein